MGNKNKNTLNDEGMKEISIYSHKKSIEAIYLPINSKK